MFTMTLERNREDRERYVSLVKYEKSADGVITPYRWTYEMRNGLLMSTRIQRLSWSAIKRERHTHARKVAG